MSTPSDRTRTLPFLLFAVSMAVAGGGPSRAADGALAARAATGADTVFVGEPFLYRIQVSGSESPKQPDLSQLGDFHAAFKGGGSNSRRSVRIINGRTTENVQLGYVFNYELRAKRPGRLTIPAIPVTADDKTALTQPLSITARKPSETGDFKLRLGLSKDRAYAGEQLTLEVVFYFRANVSEPQLTIPVVDHDAFEVFDLEGSEEQKPELLDGKQFNTLRIRKVLVPRRPGEFPVEPATLSFKGEDGTEIAEDFFGRRVRRPRYRRFVIPSNALDLSVRPLPAEGRPRNFAGHVGQYQLSAQASPVEVNVGDPITLNLSVSGPPFLEPVRLPPLDRQKSLTRDFKVPAEIEDGAVDGNFKVFTQTVRALRDGVEAIPPIELPYFDTAAETYKVARSEPIPITVRPTKVLTAGDVEGRPLTAAQQEIQTWMQGIAHNYTGPEVLSSRPLGFSALSSPARLALVAGPPLAYALLLTVVVANRNRRANPELVRARRALARFDREAARAPSAEQILAAFRTYLGAKLTRTPDALTFHDVAGPLNAKGVDEDRLDRLRQIFVLGEASRFAGGGGEADTARLHEEASKLARELDKILK